MSESYRHLETQLVHAGEPLPRIAGAVEMPIFQSATYEYAGEGSYHDVRYLRTNNTPSQLALHAKIAALEKAPAALCRKIAETPSGGEIEIWGDGKQTRSFLYVDECLEGVRRLM